MRGCITNDCGGHHWATGDAEAHARTKSMRFQRECVWGVASEQGCTHRARAGASEFESVTQISATEHQRTWTAPSGSVWAKVALTVAALPQLFFNWAPGRINPQQRGRADRNAAGAPLRQARAVFCAVCAVGAKSVTEAKALLHLFVQIVMNVGSGTSIGFCPHAVALSMRRWLSTSCSFSRAKEFRCEESVC